MSRTVPDASNIPSQRLIHIAPGAESAPTGDGVLASLAGLAAAQGTSVASCGDVYRGLARALRSEPDAVCVVALDDLTADEFEFFTILNRERPDVTVLVYSAVPDSGRPSSDREAEAIRLGATMRLADHRVAEPLKQPATPQDDAPEECVEPVQTNEASELDLSGSRADTLDFEPDLEDVPVEDFADPQVVEDEVDEEVVENTADETGQDSPDDSPADPERPRVPWLAYGNSPARRKPPGQNGPERVRPQSSNPTSASEPINSGDPTSAANPPGAFKPNGEANKSPDANGSDSTHPHALDPVGATDETPAPFRSRQPQDYEPLLSEEELEALIGDDISAIAPRRKDSSPTDEQPPHPDTIGGDE
jgi:hypothetical protein